MLGNPRYGFRFFASDAVVLLLAIAGTWWLWGLIGSFALFIPLAVGHFFLFCNIFRLHRKLELIWAAVFLVNVSVWVNLPDFAWWKVLSIQLPLTAIFLTMEVRSDRYHGIFSRQWNPHLDAYLAQREAQE